MNDRRDASERLTELNTIEELDAFVAADPTTPVILYKHSLTCGTSAMALEEIRDLVADPAPRARVGLVLIQPARTVSNEISNRYGIRHESPQVLVIHNGRAVWNASHYRVTAEAITAALGRSVPEASRGGSAR